VAGNSGMSWGGGGLSWLLGAPVFLLRGSPNAHGFELYGQWGARDECVVAGAAAVSGGPVVGGVVVSSLGGLVVSARSGGARGRPCSTPTANGEVGALGRGVNGVPGWAPSVGTSVGGGVWVWVG